MKFLNQIIRHTNSGYYPLLSTLLLILALPWVGTGIIAFIALVPLFLFITDERVTRLKRVVYSTLALFLFMLFVAFPFMRVEGTWWNGTHILDQFFAKNLQYTLGLAVVVLWRTAVMLLIVPVTHMSLRKRYGPFCVASVYALLEWGFATFGLWGYSAGVLGYDIVGIPLIKESAAAIGVYGLSFILVFTNSLIAQSIRGYPQHGGTASHTRLMAIFHVVVVLCVLGFGVFHYYDSYTG